MNQPIDEKTQAALAKQGLVAVSRQDAQSAGNCLAGSMLLSIAIIVASFYWGGFDLNNFWWMAPLTILGGSIPPIVSGLLRKSWKKGLSVLFTSLIPSVMITLMIGFGFGLALTGYYIGAPRLTQFAQEDFAKYQSPGTTEVRSDDLQQVIDKQTLLRNDKTRLDYLKKSLDDLTAVAPAAKGQMQAAIDSAAISLTSQMMADEELWRLAAVVSASYRAGTALPSTAAPAPAGAAVPPAVQGKQRPVTVYTVTRSQLTGYRSMLESKYPLWSKLLHRFGSI